MATITIPDFQFTSHFYAEIYEDLIQFARANVPELSDEDPTEPHIQLLRAYALSAHLSNVLLDIVANEMFLPTAKLRSSHRNLLALIDVKLKQPSPASADILFELTQLFASTVTTIPAKTQFATLETVAAQSIEFEVLSDLVTPRTDLVEKVYGFDVTGAGTFTDHTTEAQSPAGSFTVGWGAADVEAGDILYVGHSGVLWDQITFDVVTPLSGGTISEGVWEYFDGNFDQGNPSSVTNLGTTLRFNVNSILGTNDRTGAVVRVRSNLTGAFQDLVVAFDGGSGENRITTVAGPNGFLGQVTPSTAATDYTVGTEWRELSDVIDGTVNFSAGAGEQSVTFTLPQTLLQNWRKTLVGTSSLEFEAYWIRFRVITVTSTPSPPVINEVRIKDGKQFQVVVGVQGRSRTDTPLGSSNGDPSQQFIFTNSPVIDDTNLKVFVDEGGGSEREYTLVDNFLNSLSTDRHFTVEYDDDGIATITFGDAVNGKIPPAGVNNIRSEYRTMDEIDGNVGADVITVNRSGVAYLANNTNPRPASGFVGKEGGTTEDLNRLKISGPAELRIRKRAVSTEDAEALAVSFVGADGSRPVKRALGIEEAFGPKTIEVVVVGPGGTQVLASKLQEIEDFFNGTLTTRGKIVMNHQATVTNFLPEAIDVTATVDGGNLTAILTALTGLLNPLTTRDDGNFAWAFGGLVPRARIIQEIMNTDPPPRNVVLTTPAADVVLGTRELPTAGVFTITVNL